LGRQQWRLPYRLEGEGLMPFATPPNKSLPPQMLAQMQPYIDYFEAKYAEVDTHNTLPFELDAEGNLNLPERNDAGYWLLPGDYMTGSFDGGKRIIMLGTPLGIVALYEVDYDVKVPLDVDPSGKITVTNYKFHAPPVFWNAGLLELNVHGKADIHTFFDAFGYPEREGRSDHNDHNIAKRLELISAELDKRTSGVRHVEELQNPGT
jgi:hypothetical protein